MKKKFPLAAGVLVLSSTLVLIPIICSILYFSTAVAARQEETAQNTASFYLEQIAERTSSTLGVLRGCIYYLMSDDCAQEIMQHPEEATADNQVDLGKRFARAFFAGSQLDGGTVSGIYLMTDKTYLPVLQSGIYRGAETRITHVYQELREKNSARDLYVVPAYPNYCYLIVDYFDLSSMIPLGKIIVELQPEGFENFASLTALYQQAEVVFSTTSGTPLNTTTPEFAQAARAETGYLDVANQRYYHAKQQISPTHTAVSVFIPYDEIIAASRNTIRIYLFFSAVVLLLTILIDAWGVRLLTKPLKQVMQNLECMSTGDLTVRMSETPYVETEQIAVTFNHMADHLEELFEEVYEQGVLLRDAEFRLLESQIRPHFIFNVLELINMRCMEAGQNDICRIVTNLAQLLRANIGNKHKQTITFQEELQYVRYYLELQKERFGDHLQYSIELEDLELLNYSLPKLTLQPLVENSIVHGIEPKRGGGSVHVSIWEEEDAVCFRVADDGVGFDAALIDFQTTQTGQPEQIHNHVALANIARRIQLLYGPEFGMKIQSEPGKGTEITVTLPANIQEPGKGEEDHV